MSQTLKRKRKQEANVDVSPSKKKSRKDDKKKKEKGKSKISSEKEFTIISASLVVSIPPVFATNLRAGAEEMLDSMIMRYIPAFRGIVLAHSNLQFIDTVATIKADCPFSVCKIGFDATVWSPRVGMKMVGQINLCSPDHISLLVHRTFNVSIPRHHIPTDTWEFEYGPAENDPEFGRDAVPETNGDDNEAEHKEADGGGRWVNKSTEDKIGSVDGFLEFTVIGLNVANEMLSLLGSIQADPFSPKHVPVHVTRPETSREPSLEADPLQIENEVEPNVSEDNDLDTFQHLGAIGDAIVGEEDAENLVKSKKGKKKKRKNETGEGKQAKEKSKRKKTS